MIADDESREYGRMWWCLLKATIPVFSQRGTEGSYENVRIAGVWALNRTQDRNANHDRIELLT
jgi:hypothetical protein